MGFLTTGSHWKIVGRCDTMYAMHTNPNKADPKGVLLRLPIELHQQVADTAAANGVSTNAFLIGVIAGAMRWRSPDAEADR